MSDPISRLDQFRADTPGAPMKSAAEVRRRGDQIRRRRRAVVATGAAAVAAAVAGPIIFLSAGFGDRAIDPAPPAPSVTDSPTPSETSSPSSPSSNASAAPLTEANLLTTSDVGAAVGPGLVVDGGPTSHLEAVGVGEIPCDLSSALTGNTGALGYSAGFSAAEGGDGDADHYFSEAIAQFEPGQAQAAYDAVKAELAECSPDGADQFDEHPWQSVQIPVSGTAELGGGGYGPTTAAPGTQYDTGSEFSWVYDVGIIVSGDRVAIVVDLATRRNSGDTSSIADDLLPVAAARLTGQPVGGTPPEPSTTPEPTLSESNLLTGEDAVYPNGGPVDWVEAGTSTSDTPPTNPCWQGTMKQRGAIATMQRDFAFETSEGGDSNADAYLNETIAEFSSKEEAQAAYEDVLTWLDGCRPEGSDSFKSNRFAGVPMAAQAEGVAALAIYGPITAEPGTQYDPAGREDEGWFLEMGVVLSGDRIAVISQLITGMDYNWPAEDGGTPVEQMLPTAGERLSRR